MQRPIPTVLRYGFLMLLSLAATSPPLLGQGAVVPGAGAVNRSMAGAGVASPLDAAGTLYWNPAALTGLRHSEVTLGSEFIYPIAHLSSSLPANAFGPGVPPVPISGHDRTDSGVYVLPNVAAVYKPAESPWSYGLGIFSTAGFSANFPGDPANPILSPRPPGGFGVGSVYSRFSSLEVTPSLAYQVTERLSIGLGATLATVDLQTNPAFFGAPTLTPAGPVYPTGDGSRLHWGLGFQVGAYWQDQPSGWALGVSLKSPRWFETITFHSTDPAGNPLTLRQDVELPLIVSLGAAYSGFDRTVLALDLRYLDYHDTAGFGTAPVFAPNGTVGGLGWRSVFVVAAGAQYQITDALSARAGYLFTQNPIRSDRAFFNIQVPALYQHALFVGNTLGLTEAISLSTMAFYSFPVSIAGVMETPAGPIPGSTVRLDQRNYGLAVNFTFAY
jgi:long-chain fatty acid transport protein